MYLPDSNTTSNSTSDSTVTSKQNIVFIVKYENPSSLSPQCWWAKNFNYECTINYRYDQPLKIYLWFFMNIIT